MFQTLRGAARTGGQAIRVVVQGVKGEFSGSNVINRINDANNLYGHYEKGTHLIETMQASQQAAAQNRSILTQLRNQQRQQRQQEQAGSRSIFGVPLLSGQALTSEQLEAISTLSPSTISNQDLLNIQNGGFLFPQPEDPEAKQIALCEPFGNIELVPTTMIVGTAKMLEAKDILLAYEIEDIDDELGQTQDISSEEKMIVLIPNPYYVDDAVLLKDKALAEQYVALLEQAEKVAANPQIAAVLKGESSKDTLKGDAAERLNDYLSNQEIFRVRYSRQAIKLLSAGTPSVKEIESISKAREQRHAAIAEGKLPSEAYRSEGNAKPKSRGG